MSSSRQVTPPAGTRDFLAGEIRHREQAFLTVRSVFERFGFEPLQTPAFERLEVLSEKYGEEGDRLIFKILRRGEWEGTGDADLALRYDLTVPLARVVAAYGSRLPAPYKRYAIAPVWRADRPGRGRYREFFQCDLDQVGSSSFVADGEVVIAVYDALTRLGIPGFSFQLNSRKVLAGLLDVLRIPVELGPRVFISLDKLDKRSSDAVRAELVERGLTPAMAKSLVADLTAPDAGDRIRFQLRRSEVGAAGLQEVDAILSLVADEVSEGSIRFVPNLVRGLDYYTGPIWEVVTAEMPGSIASGGRYDHLIAQLGGPDVPACGGSLGIERILDLVPRETADRRPIPVAVTVMEGELIDDCFRIATELRRAEVATTIYLGPPGRLGKQLRWASTQGACFALIYGPAEHANGSVTVRDMGSGEQVTVPAGRVVAHIKECLIKERFLSRECDDRARPAEGG